LRSAVNTYPMVSALRDLAAEVRVLVGADTQISYAADWSEYFGHQPADGTDHVAFHLDPLWADDTIDFVGIDWYAPLTDWRDGTDHLDYQAGYKSIYDPAYLQTCVAGGEGYDWYYASDADRLAQIRSPITDGAYGEPWVFRPKALSDWWSNLHHDRPNGVRSATPTEWAAGAKPVRLIEFGCGAVDKGPNAPNLFLDPKSSESALPPFSTGARDDQAQRACLSAFMDYYQSYNPISAVYGQPMMADMSVWCWDARPYPYFPQRADLWGDTQNWRTGHWLNGRVGLGEARNLISDITAQAGLTPDQLNLDEVRGTIDGYVIDQPMTAGDALSPVLAYLGLSVAERGAGLHFIGSDHGVDAALGRDDLAYYAQNPVMARRDLVETPAGLPLRCYDPDRDYQLLSVTIRAGDQAGGRQIGLDLPLLLSAAQAYDYADYVLRAAQGLRHSLTLDIDPLRLLTLEVGDGLTFEGDGRTYRLMGVNADETPSLMLEPAPEARALISVDPSVSGSISPQLKTTLITGFRLLELPCFGVDEQNVRPILVPSAYIWAGVDVYAGVSPSSLRLRGRVEQAAGIGKTLSALPVQRRHYLLREAFIDIYLEGPAPVSRSEEEIFSGENFVCVKALNGEWEIIQFLNVSALGADQYRLSGLVRGQWGSEQALLAGMEAGSDVILLPPGFVRADMASDEMGLSRLWRTGRIGFGGAVDQVLDVNAVWSGLALRPRAPVYGRVSGQVSGMGDLSLSWLRSPRYGGDSWEVEPPLCEDYELYRLRVWAGDVLKRELEVAVPEWLYSTGDQMVDFPSGLSGDSYVTVAQKSQTYGYGPDLRIDLL
ncbi:MAG: glycoside hydrolase/phage tail family protein, partial [Asticcacaulis sp.]